jgi:hypothetical protein
MRSEHAEVRSSPCFDFEGDFLLMQFTSDWHKIKKLSSTFVDPDLIFENFPGKNGWSWAAPGGAAGQTH